jgi:uncharacterized membrane-anchored protein YjiN (DUF445 family)
MKSDQTRQIELEKMKRTATALFWVVMAVFVLAKIYEPRSPWLGFLRAFAEAAMVGALADWFAVTALFRHPLGLKIPHTAILPTRKDEIGAQLGQFVQENFLAREVIADKVHSMDAAQLAARWLSAPENSRRLAGHVTSALAAMAQVMNDEDVQGLIERNVAARIQATRFSSLAANILGIVMAGNRHQNLLYGTLKLVSHLVAENERGLRKKIGRETPWWLPRAVDDAIYDRLVKVVDDTTADVRVNSNHPLHEKFTGVVNQFIEELRTSPDVEAQEQAIKAELLEHPVVREFSASLWADIKAALLGQSAEARADLQATIAQGLTQFGHGLLADDRLLAKLNLWAEEIAHYFISQYGHEVAHLIAATVSRWDAAAATRKMELNIGKDLQYIRINGTIVGGLVGLVIHTLSLWL